MSGILASISALTKMERNIFFDTVLENKKDDAFLIILKSADPDAREAFYFGLPEALVKWWEARIAEIKPASEALLHSAVTEISTILEELDWVASEIKKHEQEHKKMIKEARAVMKAGADAGFHCISDQVRGLEAPPIQKAYDPDATVIDLPHYDRSILKKTNIVDCIADRKSRRKFTDAALTWKELSYLLWATQGVRKVSPDGKVSYRTVPSGGARQPFETYLAINRVEGANPGLYRYLPLEHKLLYLFADKMMSDRLTELALGQAFVGRSAVCFIWSTIPYRTEWRYTLEAKKDILQESGHICQNLYLACESIACGTCAVGAYNQQGFDEFLNLDGEDEFVIYLAPVGRVKE